MNIFVFEDYCGIEWDVEIYTQFFKTPHDKNGIKRFFKKQAEVNFELFKKEYGFKTINHFTSSAKEPIYFSPSEPHIAGHTHGFGVNLFMALTNRFDKEIMSLDEYLAKKKVTEIV